MFKQVWSYRVVLRYSLFQLPGLVALVFVLIFFRWWLNIPVWLMWTIVLLWVAKDIIMFPFVWRAYDKFSPDSLVGSKGKAVERLSPTGYIIIQGELWRAEVVRGNNPVNKGETVVVRGSQGLTLLVQSETDNESVAIRH